MYDSDRVKYIKYLILCANIASVLYPTKGAATLVELNNNKIFHVLTLHNNLWLAILFLKALLLHMGLIGIHLFIHIVVQNHSRNHYYVCKTYSQLPTVRHANTP